MPWMNNFFKVVQAGNFLINNTRLEQLNIPLKIFLDALLTIKESNVMNVTIVHNIPIWRVKLIIDEVVLEFDVMYLTSEGNENWQVCVK